MKVVYKYGTGQEIPSDAKYLCTQVETIECHGHLDGNLGDVIIRKSNALVWHYYELKLPTKEEAK